MENAHRQYEHIREKIVHEDDLVNQRITWAITLNGLLFTAYGFSLGADAGAIAALAATATKAQADAYAALVSTISILRQGMIYVGIGSSAAAFLGVVAAYRSIKDDEALFEDFRQTLQEPCWYPLPIGRVSTNIMGMTSGLAIPFLIAGVWLWIGKLVPDIWFILIGASIACVVGLSLWPLLPRNNKRRAPGV